jgi:hypothetical protein
MLLTQIPGKLGKSVRGREQGPDSIRELNGTSQTLLEHLELLQRLEEDMRGLDATDPRVRALAAQVRVLSASVLDMSMRQRTLGEWLAAADPAQAPAVEDAPPRELALILGDWRDAERRWRMASVGSLDAKVARADVDRFRDEYARAHAAAAEAADDWARRP